MKIKRYFATDMRQAIRKVREEQGPDAVILSNRKVNGGVEIIAALDYDPSLFDEPGAAAPSATNAQVQADAPTAPSPADFVPPAAARAADPVSAKANAASDPRVEWVQDPALTEMRQELKVLRGIVESQLSHLAWADQARRNPIHAALMQRFEALGLNRAVARNLATETPPAQDLDEAWRRAIGVLAHRIEVTDDDILNRGGAVAVVGPTGVGKTTMVAKLAARYALRHGKRHVALISTDTFRIGAYEQLHTYGQLLGVPVYSVSSRAELDRKLSDLRDKRLILIDTAGMSQRDMRLSEQLEALTHEHQRIETYLVLSANVQQAALNEVVQSFARVRLSGCLVSKVDEAASLGGVISTLVRHRLPVAYVGDGQRVPEDLHPARAHTLISRAVALMQQHDPNEEQEHLNAGDAVHAQF